MKTYRKNQLPNYWGNLMKDNGLSLKEIDLLRKHSEEITGDHFIANEDGTVYNG